MVEPTTPPPPTAVPPTPLPNPPPEEVWFRLRSVTMYLTSATLIWAWRLLRVVTFGAEIRSTPWRCSRALITTRNCGSVRIPVPVKRAGREGPPGAWPRRPPVKRLSAALGNNVPGLAVVKGGDSGPGKTPLGLPAEEEVEGLP